MEIKNQRKERSNEEILHTFEKWKWIFNEEDEIPSRKYWLTVFERSICPYFKARVKEKSIGDVKIGQFDEGEKQTIVMLLQFLIDYRVHRHYLRSHLHQVFH